MGKHRNRRQNANALVGPNRDLAAERQVMTAKVGDMDPRVQGILGQIPEATEAQQLELKLLLQKIARGKASLLERPEAGDLVERMRAEAHHRDRVVERYNEDKEHFIEEVFDRSEKIKLTGAKAEEVKARAAKQVTELAASFRGRNSISRRKFEQIIESQPRRQINVTGHVEMVKVGQGYEARIAPEVIRIKHLCFVLHPGPHIVPESVAQIFEQRIKGAAETAARTKALQATGEAGRDTSVFGRWQQINDEFGSATEMPQAFGLL